MDWTGKKVVVTTDKRGVFFGTVESRESDTTLIMRDVRNCLYWSRDVKGFLGLTTVGPIGESRVGPPVAQAELLGVTGIWLASDTAVAQWEQSPWS